MLNKQPCGLKAMLVPIIITSILWLGLVGLVLAEQYKISWTAPVARADGTALSLSEIDVYELYYMVNDEWVYLRDKDIALSQTMQINLGPGPYKFALKTVDTGGRLSVMSDSVVSPPGTPGVPVIVCPP